MEKNPPVKPQNEIVVYQPNETIRLDVRLENDTVWLTQDQMGKLFGRNQSVIARHIGNIFKEGELDRDSVYAKFAYTAGDGKTYQVANYNLDVVISVGYRVKSVQGTRFRQWATRVLKEFMLRGYAYSQRLAQLEDKVDRRLARHDGEIAELKGKVDYFVKTREPPLECVFYQGRFWDAKSLLVKFVRRARRELVVIDPYPGVATLDILAKRGRGVSIEFVTHSNGELAESDFEAFGRQSGKFTKTICGTCHDRFIIVDQKEVFWTGASLKDAGRLTFAAAKMGAEVIPGLLDSIRRAATETIAYPAGKAAEAKI